MPGGWKAHLETGIPEVDKQHQEITDAIGALGAALACADGEGAAHALDCLRQYVLVHFEAEERWMRANRFPLLREHVAKHDQFITRVVALSRDHAEEGPTAVLRLRLRNALAWLEAHIEDDDRDLARHSARGGTRDQGSPAPRTRTPTEGRS
jgi:hemerythrin